MKILLLGLLMLASSSAFSQQSFSCNSKLGYSCQEDLLFSGKFSRNALCFAYGEEVVGIDEAEEAKIFSSSESCENFSVIHSECELIPNYSEKFCVETAGQVSSLDSSCLRCK